MTSPTTGEMGPELGWRRQRGRGIAPERPRAGPRGCAEPALGESRKISAWSYWGLTGLVQTGLLALDGAGVPGEEAGLLQCRAVVRRVLGEGAGDGQTQGAGLARGATTVEQRHDVELLLALDEDQRRLDELLVHLVREVLLEGAAVQGELTGAGDPHAGDGFGGDGLGRALGNDRGLDVGVLTCDVVANGVVGLR